jgi:hypothetical protein
MAAITEWRAPGFFTTTQINRIGFLRGKCNWLKLCALMRAITERLVLASATGAPVVGISCFDFDCIGLVLWAYWFRHDFSCWTCYSDVAGSINPEYFTPDNKAMSRCQVARSSLLNLLKESCPQARAITCINVTEA